MSLADNRPSLPTSIGPASLIVSVADSSACEESAGTRVSVRPSSSTVARSDSGTGWYCSTIRVVLSWLLLFHAIHTPSPETISAASAISSPRLIQRRRARASGDSLIARQLPTAVAVPQAPSFRQSGRRRAPNRPCRQQD